MVEFFTARPQLTRSSPAKVTSMELEVTVKPMGGRSLGVRVGGSWFREPESGFVRVTILGAGFSDTQQIKPPEEADGEKPGGGAESVP